VVGIDWRGCGDSDLPPPGENFSNYMMAQHAEDMLAALDALGIGFCHLATHSTGGIIATRMLLAAPGRFGKVLALDPVSPRSLKVDDAGLNLFRAMRDNAAVARAVMATAAASLFDAASLAAGQPPMFRDGIAAQRSLFERILDQLTRLPGGIWLGTPTNLTLEYDRNELAPRMADIRHEHLVLWGEQDGWIPMADLRAMATSMPACRLVAVPGVGHSMNLENPALYAGYFGGFFGGLRS
jgi:pimeloyl-ACP methyl ester carboxylesterase